MRNCLLSILCFVSIAASAQSQVQLKTGAVQMHEPQTERFSQELPAFGKRQYAIVRFDKQLRLEDQDKLAAQGIHFLASVDGAYFLSYPIVLTIERFAIKPESYGAYEGLLKLNDRLLSAAENDDVLSVRLLHTGEHEMDVLLRAIDDAGGKVSDLKLAKYNIVSVEINANRLLSLAEIAPIMWIEHVPLAEEALRYQAVRDDRANVLQSNEYGLTGAGITVGVGDAGKVGDHIDLNGHTTNYSTFNVHSHATHVSGIIAGKPNLDPSKGTGVAPGATLVGSFFSNIITDAERHMVDHDMLITNNSYGSATSNCDLFGDYDLSSVFIDAQLNKHDTLTHVFAAGNSGGKTCAPYPARYATILTGWQVAKNTISVGMTSNKDGLSGASSRGPVDDGRLKPEIVAVGNGVTSTRPNNLFGGGGGTSYSSPAIAGITTLLYEQYINLNGSRPKAALIKALMLNTADDLGRAGPDYFFGYGRVNARRAVESLTAGNYFEGDIAQGDSVILNINVASGAAEVRVMLLWNDPAGAPFASPAITNDLDITLIDPSSQPYLPWTLDPSPTGVKKTAVRGHDALNNHEQVTIKNPAAGNFTIKVKGSNIPIGMQHYVVVYEVVMPGITVIHPNGYEVLRPGSSDIIRWDAAGDAVGTYQIEYSFDGSTWQTLSASVSASRRYLNWTVPDSSAQSAILRVSAGGFSDSSNQNIIILGAPSGLTVTSPCATFAQMSWQLVDGADHYRIYKFADNDMQLIDTTSGTSYSIAALETGIKNWYSVSAVMASNAEGPRAAAKSIIPSTNNQCPWARDMRVIEVLNLNNGRINTSSQLSNMHSLSVQIVNAGTDTASGFDVSYTLNGGSPVVESFSGEIPPGVDTTFTFSAVEDLSIPDNYAYTIWVNLFEDEYTENDTLEYLVTHGVNPPVNLPWTEGFETTATISLNSDAFAFGGLSNWDYNINSGRARLRSWAGSEFIISGERAITLDETLYNVNAVHNITATLDLSAYDTTTDDIRLTFDFIHHELIPDNDANDEVWIRGSDTATWIALLDLYSVHTTPGEITKLNSGLAISDALKANNQNFSSSFQLRFGQEGKASADSPGSEDGYTFDNIKLFGVTNDIKLAGLEAPQGDGCGLAIENIAVNLVNTSSTFFENIAVSYSVDGNTPVTEILERMLAGSDTIFTFATAYDFSADGEYQIDVWFNHTDDNYHANDSLLNNAIFSFPTINTFPYFEDFETGSGGWLSSGIANSFELGSPGSSLINKAASGQHAWVTNLTGDYNHDEASYLTSPCFDLSALTQPVLSFAQIQELENNYDFLWVEYSDNGGAWTKLGAVGEGTNWYNDASKQAWDNVNSRWHVASIDVPVNSSQVQFRFAFISDIGLQLEGAGIDAIHVHEKEAVYYGASVTPASQSVSGNDWVHFDTPDGRVISIHPGGQNLGQVDANVFFHTGSLRNDGNAYVYFRNWVIDASQSPVTPVKVRLYFTEIDFALVANAAGCGNCVTPKDAFESESFKFSGSVEDSIMSNNISGVTQHFDNNEILILPYDNGYALELEVSDFSEFWLTGLRTQASDTLFQKINSTSDDAKEFIISGGVNPFSDSLELDPSYLTGLRYSNVSIPQGAFIKDARLIFISQSDQIEQGDILIFGESGDNINAFSTGNLNISSRAKTALHFNWEAPLWQLDDTVTTPTIRAILQEMVDRPGWKPGNALGFSLAGMGDAKTYAYDADPAKAVKLFITYDSTCDLQQRLYVDLNATGDNTGDSWADAMPGLQHAINLAIKCDGITEIWVSQGTYLPGIDGQDKTFRLKNGVELYGGFTGSETLIAQRDPAANVTVLSGDVGIVMDTIDNAFHVVTVDAGSDTVRVDGFTIKNGNAFGTLVTDQSGAGIHSSGNIFLQNCIIENCAAQLDGSGIFHAGINMTFTLSNCILRNNTPTVIKNTGSGSMLISDDNNIQNNE